ncbi:hypothetical protein [Paraburkholderia sp. GAS334]|jgi:hypothetical protein|uniref:hypothetical protein n=1 Tax=unclassified Paraburkholderia TaxID=2615204 RepID=UPI003D1E3DF8
MQDLIVASISAMFLGALATCLIARFMSDEVALKGSRNGRYAYLGEDGVKEIERPSRRNRRLSQQRPTGVGRGTLGYRRHVARRRRLETLN